ncbi:MAG: hypothetical protein U5L72_19905 [Bacteroidales bacterium]|nr:hypothetical protein [Bacteroidales bacterium]
MTINDSGALPFVIAARVEAAVKALTGTEASFLPDMIAENSLLSSSRGSIQFLKALSSWKQPGYVPQCRTSFT